MSTSTPTSTISAHFGGHDHHHDGHHPMSREQRARLDRLATTTTSTTTTTSPSITSSRVLNDAVTRIVGGVMVVATVLFAAYAVVDRFQGLGTVWIRAVGAVVLLICTFGWLQSRRRSWRPLEIVSGLAFSGTVSLCTTLVTEKTNTTFEIAMAYGLVIAILNVLFWRSLGLVLLGCLVSIGPPAVLMISERPARDPLIDFLGVIVVTVVLAIVISRVAEVLVRELAILQEQLVIEASRDSLTGLPSRRHWLARLTAWRAVNPATPYDILFVDLDRFKEVNDRHGHHVGDRVLVTVAAMLEGLVPADGAAARFGGDEFVVFIPGGGTNGDRFMERLTADLAASDVAALGIDLSVGRAASAPGLSVEDVLWRADQDLLARKRESLRNASTETADASAVDLPTPVTAQS